LIGTVLQQAGHEVVLKDFLLPPQKSSTTKPRSFQKYSPAYIHYGVPLEDCLIWLTKNAIFYDAVGLMLGQCNIFETGFILANHIKQKLHLPLVIGGPFATTAPQTVLQNTKANVIVVGEGEGIVNKAFELAIKKNPPVIIKGPPMNLKDIPLPDWGLAPPKNYPNHNGKIRGVLTVSRGCPWKCRFCSVHTIMGRKYRKQDRQRIKEELLHLWNYGVRHFCFLDDNLFYSQKAIKDVFWAIDRLKKEVPGFNKASFYTEEGIEVRIARRPGFLKQLRDRRFESLTIGLETMNETNRKDSKKPFKTSDLIATMEQIKKYKIPVGAFYIIGFPKDTLQSVCRDIVSFGKLGLGVRANNLKVYPNTDLTKDFIQRGIISKDYDWRQSSWHTPQSGQLTYKQIKQLKSVLRAVGYLGSFFGVAIFADALPKIQEKMKVKKYILKIEKDNVTIKGNMFRPTIFLHIAILLLLRKGSIGAVVKQIDLKTVKAMPRDYPQNDIQREIAKILHPQKMKLLKTQKGFGL